MVLLTMTAPMVEALRKHQGQSIVRSKNIFENDDENENGPSLEDPEVGKPISHAQVLHLSHSSKNSKTTSCGLDYLLRGTQIYIPTPPPKPEPTAEYKALMARLRREEESRAYGRMTQEAPAMETFSSMFPSSSAAHAFSSTAAYMPNTEIDEITYADINRQVMLIFNVIISVFATAAAIWNVGKWWSTHSRLALSMFGAALVGVAEVAVYFGYIRRLEEAKGKERGIKEVKEVVKTWVVGGDEEPVIYPVPITRDEVTGVRERKRNLDVD